MGTFADAFYAAAGPDGVLRFDRFMALALYDPEHGYYRKRRRRVGRDAQADFYTARSVPLFAELMGAACAELLGGPSKAGEYTFVEIGAEPGSPPPAGIVPPFARYETRQLGEPLALTGRLVVFSNELFDAQPFRRFRKGPMSWLESGVRSSQSGWEGVDLRATSATFLPEGAPEGYQIDAPTQARELSAAIAAEPWTGLFIAADYGKSWDELALGTPTGTARAYRNHQQSNDLLADPGEQDLTCHVCWDWIEAALAAQGFVNARLESQEAFLVRHAEALIAPLVSASTPGPDYRKQALMQLLHPSLMGRKFQMLYAFRSAFAKASADDPPG